MFFRNLTLFRIPADIAAEVAEGLVEGVEKCRLKPCGPLELATQGFVPAMGPNSDLVHRSGDFSLIAVGTEAKLLPASVVAEYCRKEVADIEEREGRKVIMGRERKRIKDAVITKLLTQAFTRTTIVHAYIDHARHWLVVDTASHSVAETVVSLLRNAIGRFPATPVAPADSPRSAMTAWVGGRVPVPSGYSLGDECELRDMADASNVVRARNQDLACEEIREHIGAGKDITRLGLMFDGRLSFVLGDDLTIRKLYLTDVVLDELSGDCHESAESELEARFALMRLEVRRLLESLSELFGIGVDPALRLDPPPTPKSMRNDDAVAKAARDPRILDSLAGICPKGPGESVTISVPDSDIPPVTLTAEDGKRLRKAAKRLRQ